MSQPEPGKESFIKVKTLSIDTIKSMAESVSMKPGLTADIAKKELEVFQFRQMADQTYEVCLPNNLEFFADNWVARLAVVAGLHLKATFVSSREDVKELKFVGEMKEYLHGVAAAIRQSMEGGITYEGTSGKFHQGFSWAVSQTLARTKNSNLYKLDYTSLWLALTGNAVWNANAPSWQRYLYQLVLICCRNLNIVKAQSFAKSPQEVIQTKFARKWAFQQRSTFSDFEITYMNRRYEKELSGYESWREGLKKNWEQEVDQVFDTYDRLTKDLRSYDARIQAIATIRANAIFRSTKRGKKDTVPSGLTREGRLEYLSFAAWIQATNPTGLGSDDRIETRLTQNDDELAANEFMDTYLEIFKRSTNTAKDLLDPWLKTAEMKANAIIKASKA